MANEVPTRRIFSGVQPTGIMTLGNYLGALRNWQHFQDEAWSCLFCVVDLHAITAKKQNPDDLRSATRFVAASFMASGIDPTKSIIFAQSMNPAHTQLAWIFNCVARIGWLNRMTQFKEKAGKNKEQASVGLYVYPNLMAADILAYKATHVPVGADQKQHLELARDIAVKFNNDFNVPDFFPVIDPVIQGAGTRVMSLRDGTKKMSKSDPSDQSRINITDDADKIALKIRKAKTDPDALPHNHEDLLNRPEALNLVGIMAGLDQTDRQTVLNRFGGQSFKEFKQALTENLIAHITPIGKEINRLLEDPQHIDDILRQGAEKAYDLSQPILQDVYDIIGFIPKARKD